MLWMSTTTPPLKAQSGTLIGRLIAELGAENTGTADDFATMQGLLLQRRGMN